MPLWRTICVYSSVIVIPTIIACQVNPPPVSMIHIVHITNTEAVRIAIYLQHLAGLRQVNLSLVSMRKHCTASSNTSLPLTTVRFFLLELVRVPRVSLYYWIKKVTHFFLPFLDNPLYSQQTLSWENLIMDHF